MVNTYVYNKRRLLTGETLSQQGLLDLSLGQGYSSNGHLAAQTWPQGLQVSYSPNALGQPTQAGTFATGVQYYPNGAVQQFVYGNGIVHQMQQNARLLPARSTDSGTLDLLTSFDVNGNVNAINDLVQGSGHDRQMQYDALDRLTAAYSPAFGGDGWYRFGYDALDNLRTWTQPGEGQRRYDYDSSNRLTLVRNAAGAGIIGLGYDVQGNLSIKNGQAYQFDFGNRLRQATNLERYRYDGHGRRSSVIDAGSGKNRHYLYSQGGALAYLWDQGTGETTQYIQLAGSLVATRKTAAGGAVSVRYQHTDALGSPVAETNEQAGVVQRTAYTPYGASIGAQKDGVGYTGHVMDGSTGLAYMQQRYMDPTVGVFLSVDPVTALTNPVGMFHRYMYANGNPSRFIDPDGRAACGKDWDCRMEQRAGGGGLTGGQLAAIWKNPQAYIDRVNGTQIDSNLNRVQRATSQRWPDPSQSPPGSRWAQTSQNLVSSPFQ
ncbi:RHS repeat-associated core domain-containing protein [Stenotrophomonas sp.]|uniref:RHS repeat domain-containing protein n=1 Tax=Stenotrophomonas sp. TaxID=69392 RepID=UPI0028B01685|nr:RHS repeat-associated core domain-containing protein [Stenotrophomonas sp.]